MTMPRGTDLVIAREDAQEWKRKGMESSTGMEEKRDGIQGSDGEAQGRGPAEDDRSPQPAKGGCWGPCHWATAFQGDLDVDSRLPLSSSLHFAGGEQGPADALISQEHRLAASRNFLPGTRFMAHTVTSNPPNKLFI